MSETSTQIETRLTNVRQAITDIVTAGQSYSKPGLSFNRAQLEALQKLERQLELKLSRMSGGGAIILSDFSGEDSN